jgi:hypothetical protein
VHPFSSSQHSTHISLAAAHKDSRARIKRRRCISRRQRSPQAAGPLNTSIYLAIMLIWLGKNTAQYRELESLTQKAAGELLSDKYIYSDGARRLGDGLVGAWASTP